MSINIKKKALNVKNGDTYDNFDMFFLGDVEEAVDDWFEEHPEAVTNVADNSITAAKLAPAVREEVESVGDLEDDVTDLKSAFYDSEGIENISGLTVAQGVLINANGEETASSDYESTNYIEVNEGELYLVTNSAGGYPDANDQRSDLIGIAGYDEDENFVKILQDQLSGSQQAGGRHITRDYIVLIPNGIKYIRGTSAYKTTTPSYQYSPIIIRKIKNNGFNGVDYFAEYVQPKLINGTQANLFNTYAVCTDFVPVCPGDNVSCKVDKPYRANTNYYCYGYATYDSDKNVIRNQNYNSASYSASSVKIQDGEKYIKYSVREYDSTMTAVANRVSDYSDYPIKLYICGRHVVLDYVEENTLKTKNIVESLFTENVDFYIAATGKTIGFYDGSEVTGTDYDSTNYISVNPGETYMYTGVLGGNYDNENPAGGACYSANGQYLCGILSQMSTIGQSGSRRLIENYKFTIPSGAAYMRVCSAVRNGASSSYPKSNIILKKYNPTGLWANINKENDIVHNNLDMDGAIKSASKTNWLYDGYREYYTTKKNNVTFAIISDMHGAYNNFGRFAEYVNAHKGEIDIALSLGDTVLSEPKEGLFTWPNTVKMFDVPFMYVVGNHDTADTGLSAITQAECKTKYYSDIINKGFMSSSDFGGVDKCYWHKDLADYKIRIIALFEYGNSESLSTNAPSSYCRRWIDSNQLQWFADTLYNTPTDYSVVVFTHQMPWYPMTLDECLFTQNPSSLTSGMFLNTQDGRVIGDVVNAYIHGLALNETYNPIDGYGLSKTATVVKDFSVRGAGKYIANICGHVHGSYVAHDTLYTDQLTIAVPSGSSSAYQQQYSDIPVSDAGRNIDRFYVVGINTESKMINIVEIGAQDTLKMEKRNQINIPYTT